ncbi:NAD(P)/FAD-dependent oxidoreductase [Streptomyces lonarensis]|uniref:NAD(P)/FAD-dependent oxidoreductase n=1 Tax=Streptomyces lonarensis TaxID=700599 RepID=A0A7X6HYW0_9ACTN|nr:NAD(P)/FAD-dependent oxidoreductase [Streptomyces lonarensis]NJQ06001.1 NAD(P)/FAD-dependent oxidoreductase [Streptomyces lonarensis]
MNRNHETAAPGDARHHEVIVVGGGAAGLSGALTLARARRDVLVVDSGAPRNAPAAAVHGYLGREGTPPAELLAAGRAEVAAHGGAHRPGEVRSAARLPDDRFLLTLTDGTALTADRLLVATGLVDELPELPGLAAQWGRGVLSCPYCHGWEVRDRPVGVLGGGPLSVHQALLWRQWTDDLLFFSGAEPPEDEAAEQLAARGITLVPGEVTGVDETDGRLSGVRVAGRHVPREVLVIGPRLSARSGVLTDLGAELTDLAMGDHVVGTHATADATGATTVPGLWVAGNVSALTDQVIGAAAAGQRAGAAINADLVAAETRRAVAARRARSDAAPTTDPAGQ